MNQPDLFDICLNRHRGNQESREANRRVRKAEQRERALSAILDANSCGITCRELAERWGVGMNTISGRLSELKAEGLVVKAGVRDGCAVLVGKNFVDANL